MQRCLGCMKEFGKEYDICPYCGYMTDAVPTDKNHLIPRTILSDRYMLGKAIGHGGFGITYIAWDEKIQKKVAVKEYFPNALSTRQKGITEVSCYNEKAERFFKEGMSKMLDEARRISRFADNENIVDIYDYFEENNTAYIVMEYLEGKDLKKHLEENGEKISPEQAVKIILPVLNALKDMHRDKLIHRDISPDNIYMCNNGKVKLLDFGAARLEVEDAEKSLSVMVKRGYAPKEQYISRSKQGPWTDVYALCATMYKMITGEIPSESVARDDEPLKTFAEFGITGYEKLEETLFKGLEPNIQDRIQSVEALERLIIGEKATQVSKEIEKKQNKKSITNIAVIIGTIVAVVAVVLGVVFLVPDKEPEVKNPSEQVSQNVQTEDNLTVEQLPIMDNTIDLNSMDLNSEFNIRENHEISVPYSTSLGTVYLVREYLTEKTLTYLFVATQDKVIYETVADVGHAATDYILQCADVDGEPGEEIILLVNTGGNGGAGIYISAVWKIGDNVIKSLNFSDEAPFEISRKAPFTVVFENKDLNYKKEFVCKTDSESFFDETGKPETDSLAFEQYGYEYDGGFYPPHEINIYPNGDEKTNKCIVALRSWSTLSRTGDETVESVVEYVFDKEKQEFVIHNAYIDVYLYEDRSPFKDFASDEEYFASLTADNGYDYYDINNDGIDELIFREKSDVRKYKVYTFVDGKMCLAGEIIDEFEGMTIDEPGYLYGGNSMIVATSRDLGYPLTESYSSYVSYELVDNKLVEKDSGTCGALDGSETSQFGTKINLDKWYK